MISDLFSQDPIGMTLLTLACLPGLAALSVAGLVAVVVLLAGAVCLAYGAVMVVLIVIAALIEGAQWIYLGIARQATQPR